MKKKSKKKKSKKKKGKPFDYDSKKFPNYKRIIRIFWGASHICDIEIRAYIHNFESRRPYVHYTIYDPEKAFQPKIKKKRNWHEPEPKEFPNFIRKLHIFMGHDCIAEVDIRGYLMAFLPEKTNVTIHTDHTINYTGERKQLITKKKLIK